MKTPVVIRAAAFSLAAAVMLAQGCGESAHSQRVRRDARDRYDRAGAQIAYDQARQAFQSGQFEQALGHVDRAVARFPKESSYHLLRGRILHEMTRVDDAHQAFVASAELDPKKPEPHYFMGILHQRWRENDRAAESYAKAAELDPTKLHFAAARIEVLTLSGRLDEADAQLTAIERRFEFSPIIDRLRADVHKMRGDDEACTQMLERAAVRDTSSPELLEELAFARYSKGDWHGALAVLDDPALASRTGRPDLARLRARNLILAGRAAEARDVLLAIRGDNDPEGRTSLLLGHACWRTGDWGRVRECGEELVKRRPEMADGYMFLGASAGAMGRLDESLAMLEQAVAREPERESVRRMLSTVVARKADAAWRPPQRASAGSVRSEAP
ncbi:MAG: tetratricopeptide repeat protein [Planctomycetes bacterium]|nr:tetratricopeptide repeat protein [Planctomycetota bacterium]